MEACFMVFKGSQIKKQFKEIFMALILLNSFELVNIYSALLNLF